MKKGLRVGVVSLITAAMVFFYAHGFSLTDARPLAMPRERTVLRVWVTETFMGSLSAISRAAKRFEQQNPGVNVRIRRAQADEYAREGAVLPDVSLYMPGIFTVPQDVFLPSETDACVRAAFQAAGRWQDAVYGVPVLAGAYGLMTNNELYGGEFSLEALQMAAKPAQGKKQPAVSAIECPIDVSLCFPAALIAQGGGLLGGFPQGLRHEAAHGVLSNTFLSLGRDAAFTQFRQGRTASLICTQREVWRMSALEEAGKGFAFSVIAPKQAFCDQILFCSVVRGGQEELAAQFAAQLLDEAYQRELTGFGFFTVLDGLSIYNEGEMPRLYAMEQGLLSPSLICMNAYAGEKLALEEQAIAAIEGGGKDLMSVPFY